MLPFRSVREDVSKGVGQLPGRDTAPRAVGRRLRVSGPGPEMEGIWHIQDAGVDSRHGAYARVRPRVDGERRGVGLREGLLLSIRPGLGRRGIHPDFRVEYERYTTFDYLSKSTQLIRRIITLTGHRYPHTQSDTPRELEAARMSDRLAHLKYHLLWLARLVVKRLGREHPWGVRNDPPEAEIVLDAVDDHVLVVQREELV